MIIFTLGYVTITYFMVTTVEAISQTEKSVISGQVMTAALQCITDYPLKISDIEAFKGKTIPDDVNAKCFAACMFKKVGIMDDMGMLSPSGARRSAEQVFKGNEEHLKNVDKIMDICSKVNKENVMDGNKGCDRAKLVHSCLLENAPKYGFDFEF